MLIVTARAFSIAAHEAVGQKRKYTFEPYWHHCVEVAEIVQTSAVGATSEMIAAAWLHDTVEDTAISIETIEDVFGATVAALVSDLTDVSKPEDGNRAARKEIDRNHTANASPEAKTIKLADLISNSRSIKERDPDFARVYLREKARLLEVLTEGDEMLWKRAASQIHPLFA